MNTQSSQLAARLQLPVEEKALFRAKLHLMDWIACAAGGANGPKAKPFQDLAKSHGSGPCFTILGPRRPEAAAMLNNGALGNLLEMDDTDREGLIHPGDVVIPAVLAAAEMSGASGRDVLVAIVRGYEAMIRIARATGPDHYRYWHKTASCGPFGAAAGVASILGLDAVTTAHALGHAGSVASGLWQLRKEDTVTKQFHTAHAAQTGLTAARIASLGGAGPLTILEGSQGFFAAACRDSDPQKVTRDLDADWKIFGTSFKPWPSCRNCHVAIEAALTLRASIPLQEIEKITIDIFSDAVTFCDKPNPKTFVDALFSLQHTVAVAMGRGEPELTDFEPEALTNNFYRSLREKIVVQRSSECDAIYPNHLSANLTIQTSPGKQVSCRMIDAFGDPEKPVGAKDIASKARKLMARGGYPKKCAEQVLGLLLGGEPDFDLKTMTNALGRYCQTNAHQPPKGQ